MSSEKGLILYDVTGKPHFYKATVEDVKLNFKSYEVNEGKWILYSKANFDTEGIGKKEDAILELFDVPTPKTKLPFYPRSIRRLQDESDSVEVFEQFYYGGKSEFYKEGCEDVMSSLGKQGASSMIIWPNKWTLYSEENYKGSELTLPQGKYPTPVTMGFENDALKSLRQTKRESQTDEQK